MQSGGQLSKNCWLHEFQGGINEIRLAIISSLENQIGLGPGAFTESTGLCSFLGQRCVPEIGNHSSAPVR